MKQFLIFSLFFLLSTVTIAQKAPQKFGKIKITDLEKDFYEKDSSAYAYYMFDFGKSHFDYLQSRGFKLIFERHFRIKVLSKTYYGISDIVIPLYDYGYGGKEKLLNLKAVTYNIENGEIQKTKLNKKEIFTEDYGDRIVLKKFPMPKVKEGSIIEVKYVIESDFGLPEWEFQKIIPVERSDYYVFMPEMFRYKTAMKGYFHVKTEKDYKVKSINFTKAGDRQMRLFEYKEDIYHYSAKNVPEFPEEKYLTTRKNYISKVEFELASIKFPYSSLKEYTTTWEMINQRYLETDKFGGRLEHTGFLKDYAATLKSQYTDDMDLMNAALSFIKTKIRWNEQKRDLAQHTLKKVFKEGAGSSAEVNLSLVALLRKLGFKADPVVLSTRKNGIIFLGRPNISIFNYVIAYVKLNGKDYLLDATNKYSEVNLLPIRCANGRGRIVRHENSDWVDLENGYYLSQSNYKLDLAENGNFTGHFEVDRVGYGAYVRRNEFEKEEDYVKAMKENNDGLEILKYEYTGLDNTNVKMVENYDVSIERQVEKAGDLMFFNPLLYNKIEENPFKLDERKYPIEYPFPEIRQVKMTINIPENYIVESVPEPLMLKLPEKAGRYIFSIQQEGNTIKVNSVFQIKKTRFLPDEYSILKEFYGVIIEKQNEQVVLKKRE